MSEHSFTAAWKLNVEASELPFPAPLHLVVAINDEGDKLWIAEDSVDAQGRTELVSLRARFDDQLYPVEGSSMVDEFAVRRVDDRTLRTRGLKGGKEMFEATLELSPDGKSFTERVETTLADGTRAPAVLVFERLDRTGRVL